MSLPAETKFPCSAHITNDGDLLNVQWDIGDRVYFACYGNGSSACSALDRAQVESLRDQLTEWLNQDA